MTDTEQRSDELTHYVASMRRQRRWYYLVVGAVAAVALAVTLIVWFTGEITHTHSSTAATAPPAVPLGTAPAALSQTWHSSDRTAIGAPFSGGTVVTFSAHTVSGRAALTGHVDWTYTRTDRTVCQVAQIENKTIAVYANGGSCDEVTTLDTGTGARQWTRTLDENALTVTGRPAFIATADTFYVWQSGFVYAIDPDSGIDRWTFPAGTGCTLAAVVPGTSGVLMSEHCAAGTQLLLRDATAGTDDSQTTADKQNQVLWRLANTDTVPVMADSVVAALDPATRQLVTYDPAKGSVDRRISLQPAPASSGVSGGPGGPGASGSTGAAAQIGRVSAGNGTLIWIAGTGYGLDSSGTQLWSAPLVGLPTITAPDSSASPPDLASARVLVPTSTGAAALDGATGTVITNYALPAPPSGSQVYPVGNGLLVAGLTTTYYA